VISDFFIRPETSSGLHYFGGRHPSTTAFFIEGRCSASHLADTMVF
jgi:hypothetical protein